MELIEASNFPLAIKKKACEIFRMSRKRPREDKRGKIAAYCTYVSYLENGQHVNVDVIAKAYGVTTQGLRTMIAKGGQMVTKYVPPNVFAHASDIIQTFLITVGLNEDLISILQPWIDYLYTIPGVDIISPWDVCYALVSEYI